MSDKLCFTVTIQGDGRVSVDRVVTDNQWHLIEWSRKYKKLIVILDRNRQVESSTPGSERLLNIEHRGKIYVSISSSQKSSK